MKAARNGSAILELIKNLPHIRKQKLQPFHAVLHLPFQAVKIEVAVPAGVEADRGRAADDRGEPIVDLPAEALVGGQQEIGSSEGSEQ